MWKKIRSWVAALMVVCMVAGVMPWNVLEINAAGTLVDAAIFCSDVHGNSSTVTSIFNGIKSADSTFNPTTAAFVGDTQTTASSVTAAAQEVFSNVQCIYAFGNHDDEGSYGIEDFTGLSYGDSSTNYYIYTISENSMKSSNPDTSGFTSTVAGLDKSKPLFIISHMPLHERRNDNNGAAAWYTAISAAAESMDIAFFWAHNHTGDNEVDQAAYYVAKKGSETISVEGGSTVTPNFTYLNAGYIDPPNTPARNNVATAVRIYDDSVNYTVYNASGELSGTYAVNETVTREFASTNSGSEDSGTTEPETKTLTSIEVTTPPTKTTYTVGETLDTTGMVVTATYEDGSTEEVFDYTLSDVDMTTDGTKNVTVIYKDKETTFEITVNPKSSSSDTTSDGTVHVSGSGSATKTVYKLVDSVTSGNSYLIVDSNSTGTANALINSSNSVGNATVTIQSGMISGDTTQYIELENSSAVWTAGTNSSSSTFKNDSYYLYHDSGALSLSTSTNKNNWTWGTNSLYYTGGQTTRYLTYDNDNDNDSGWTLTTSSANVYLYEETEATITTNIAGTYSITGNPSNVDRVVIANATTELDYVITFTPDDSSVGATTVDPSELGGTVIYSEVTDEQNIISAINGNVITFTGTYGKATVKVSYTWTATDGTNYTIWETITVVATAPTYNVEITDEAKPIYGTDGTTITDYELADDTIAIKGVTSDTTYALDEKVTYKTADGETILTPISGISWVSSDTTIATVNSDGTVSFTGKEGTVSISVYYEYESGKSEVDTVVFSVSENKYIIPSDGTADFPEYPNEGAIRIDKTATAQGNFSETGIAQVELSMTGVPYSTGSEIDVVLMLDMTGSMTTESMAAAAALVFAQQIILNEDGTYNDNRISVQVFSVDGVDEVWELGAVTAETYASLVTAIESASDYRVGGGTPYSTALQACYETLSDAKTDGIGDDREQFCVFVSDGTPTSMTMISNYDDVKAGTATSYTTTTSSTYYGTYPEYYSTLMKDDEVTVYGVYTSAAAGSSGSSGSGSHGSGGGSVNDTEEATAIMQTVASSADKVYVVDDYTDTSAISNVFSNIALEIKQAATNVVVEDKIDSHYTMTFSLPGDVTSTAAGMSEFYIQAVQYNLDSDKERTGDPTVLENFTFNADGTLKSHTVDGEACGDICSHVTLSNGVVTAIDGTYFDYNSRTDGEFLTWTAEKLDTTELALQYFVYLDNSAGLTQDEVRKRS